MPSQAMTRKNSEIPRVKQAGSVRKHNSRKNDVGKYIYFNIDFLFFSNILNPLNLGS